MRLVDRYKVQTILKKKVLIYIRVQIQVMIILYFFFDESRVDYKS